MADFRVRIMVDPREAMRGINQVGNGLNRLERKGYQVSGVFKTMAVLGVAGQFHSYAMGLVDIIDGYTTMENRIRSSTKTQREFQHVMAEVPRVAQRSRQDLESIAKGYQAISGATETMGLSTDTILRMTETLAKGMVASGATTSETASVMTQFSQALRKGKLDGDEFRSIMENGIVVQRLLAKELGVSTKELKHLSTEGKITREVMVGALVNGAAEVDAQFAETMPTITDQITNFKNEMIIVAGTFAKSIELGAMLGAMFRKVAEDVAGLATGLGFMISKIQDLKGIAETANDATGGWLGTALDYSYALRPGRAVSAPLKAIGTVGGKGAGFVAENLGITEDDLPDWLFELTGRERGGLGEHEVDYPDKGILSDPELWFRHRKGLLGMAAALEAVNKGLEPTSKVTAEASFMGGLTDVANVAKAVIEGKEGQDLYDAAGGNLGLTKIIDSFMKEEKGEPKGPKDTFPDELRRLLGSINPLIDAEQALAETENVLEKAVRRKMLTSGQAASFLERYKQMHEDALDPIGAFSRATEEEARMLEMRWRIQTKTDSFAISREGFANTEAYELEVEALKEINRLKESGIIFSKQQEEATLAEYRAQLQKLKSMQMGVDALSALESRQKELLDQAGFKTGDERFFEEWARIKQKETSGLITAEFAARELARLAADKSFDRGALITPIETLNNSIRDLRVAMVLGKATPEDIEAAVQQLREQFVEAQSKGKGERAQVDRVSGLQRYAQSISDTSNHIAEMVENNAKRMEDALVNFFRTGEFGMEKMINAMLDDLTRFVIRFLAVQAFKAIFGGGGGIIPTGGGGGGSIGDGLMEPSFRLAGESLPNSELPTAGFAGSSERRTQAPKVFVETRVVQDSRGASLAALQSPAAKRIQIANLQSNEVALRALQGPRR